MRDWLRRLRRSTTTQPAQSETASGRADYAYRVFWMVQARTWDAGRRRLVLSAARGAIASAEFEPNAFERRYRIEGVEGKHAGASLIALIQVLEALDVAG